MTMQSDLLEKETWNCYLDEVVHGSIIANLVLSTSFDTLPI